MYNGWDYNLQLDSSGTDVWLIISIVVAIVGGIALYFTFLSKKNEGVFKGFLEKVYEFFRFDIMLSDTLLRITYLITSIYITLLSFALIGENFLSFLGTLVVGNLLLRLGYEFLLVILTICRNTTEINKKLGKGTKLEVNEKKK